MEFFLIIGGLWLVYVFFGGSSNDNGDQNDSSTHSHNSAIKKKQNPETFRPSSSSRNSSNIKFKAATSAHGANNVPVTADLDGLHDAFTGAPLDKNLGLHQCQSCKVYYHTESLQVLREANNSQCVSCQSTNIIAVITGGKTTGGKDYTPNVVTLQNYKQHEGSVVTFEGRVHQVNESRRGNDFAVMFEDKSWARGFKLVFFRDGVRKVGGKPYITQLSGKTVKVRGLVIKHPKFGYEIVVSEKSMILGVK